jgi:hypothetical protein
MLLYYLNDGILGCYKTIIKASSERATIFYGSGFGIKIKKYA